MEKDEDEYTTLTVDQALDKLEAQNEIHLKVIHEFLSADDAKMFAVDLLALSAANRSMSLISGFTTMIKDKNFICAAPLLRLQLDNSLRFYAAFLVEDPHKLAKDFIDGVSIRHFKERTTNQKLSDRLLVNRLSEHHPWIVRIYEETSGYIHLSHKHFYNVAGKKDSTKNLQFIAGKGDKFIDEKTRFEAVIAMIELTTVLLWLLNSWTVTKNFTNVKP